MISGSTTIASSCGNWAISSGEQQYLPSTINDAVQRHRWTFSLFPETREALDELRGYGYRLGVISNTTEEFPQVLAELELHWYFESVTYSA